MACYCAAKFVIVMKGALNLKRLKNIDLVSILSMLNAHIFWTNCHFGSFFNVLVTRKSCQKGLSYKKCAHLMLMKLTPSAVFLNLRAAKLFIPNKYAVSSKRLRSADCSASAVFLNLLGSKSRS
jgi:hypothetical protein